MITMRNTTIVLPLACFGMFGFAAHAQAQTPIEHAAAHFGKSAAPQDDDDDLVDDDSAEDQAPSRPGGKNHYSRNSLNQDDDDLADDDPADSQTPSRPGGKNHYSRNGVELDNSGHPVTGQGPNKATGQINDALDAAGGQHHR